MDWDRTPARVSELLSERLDDELLLYHPASTRTVRLNAAASVIWELCDGQRSARAIVNLIAEAYPGEDRQVEADVEAALATLLAEGTIQLS